MEVDVDASTGAIAHITPLTASATAHAAAHYYEVGDPRQATNATRSVYVTPSLEMEFSGPSGAVRIEGPKHKLVACAEKSGTTILSCDTEVPDRGAKGIGVDVQANVLVAARYFQSQFGYAKWADPVVRAAVNVTTLGDRDMAGNGRFLVGNSNGIYPNDQLFFGVAQTFADVDPVGHRGVKKYFMYPPGRASIL